MSTDAPIILWQTVPCWGMTSTSPFCIKLEAWLKMTGIPYEPRVLERPPRSSNRKVPYIERADGSLLADSGEIIAALTKEHGITLDDELDARQRATAVAVTRMLEDHLYWAIAWDRWIPDAHWVQTREAYFGALPWPVRALLPPLLRRSVRKAFRGQGFGRMPEAQIIARAERDLAALAELVGDRETVLGQPSTVDAIAYAFFLAALRPPWNGPLQQLARAHANLVAFADAFERRYG